MSQDEEPHPSKADLEKAIFWEEDLEKGFYWKKSDYDLPRREFSPHVVQHAVSGAREAAARLLAYGTSSRNLGHSLTNTQSLLAIDDLLSFALHTRRLLETLGLKDEFSEIEVEDLESGIGKVKFIHVLSRIIHARKLGISLPRCFWVESDRLGSLLINLESFVCVYMESIEPRVNRILWASGLSSPAEVR